MATYLRTFCIGGAAYPALELLWRGRTHWSMAVAGGLGLAWLRLIEQKSSLPFIGQAVLGGLGITGIELAAGVCVNRKHQVWDYRHMPLQIGGHVCMPYALLWCGLSGAAIAVMRAT